MATVSRICRRCGIDTPVDQLVKNKNCKDGVDALCRTCCRIQNDKWFDEHPEKKREIKQAYKKRHPEKIKQQNRAYRKSPAGKLNQARGAHNRRAKQIAAGGTFTPQDIKAQHKRQKGKCYWCGKKLGKNFEVDHVIPISRGGDNYPSNLVVSCMPCNRSKNDRLPHEWYGNGGKLL